MAPATSGIFQDLTRVRDLRSARASSYDQEGRNQDYWLIPPGERITLADIEGPGCSTHIWMTQYCRRILGPGLIDPFHGHYVAPIFEIHNALGLNWEITDPFYYRKLLLRITWDGQEHPGVLVPLGDFFGLGHSIACNYASQPFTASVKPEEQRLFGGNAALNCYLPMPFNKRARMEKTGLRSKSGRLKTLWLKNVSEYVLSSVCEPLNEFYWGEKRLDHRIRAHRQAAKTRDGLIKMFKRVKADERTPDPPTLVWRGMGGKVARDIKRLKPGETWENKGYSSTTVSPAVANNFAPKTGVIMEIKTNPNKKGVDFSIIARNSDEEEYLMDKGSRFRLVATKEVQFQRGHGELAVTRSVTVHQFEEI